METKEPDTLTPDEIERAKREFLRKKKYNEEHKEQLSEARRKWVKKYKEEHYEEDREKRRVLEKKYDETHKEQRKEARKLYYQTHREELLQKQRERREQEKLRTVPPEVPG